MQTKYLTVKDVKYKIVDESWEDRAAEVDHTHFVVYKLVHGKWQQFADSIDGYTEAEAQIPGVWGRKKCPTCGHNKIIRIIP